MMPPQIKTPVAPKLTLAVHGYFSQMRPMIPIYNAREKIAVSTSFSSPEMIEFPMQDPSQTFLVNDGKHILSFDI